MWLDDESISTFRYIIVGFELLCGQHNIVEWDVGRCDFVGRERWASAPRGGTVDAGVKLNSRQPILSLNSFLSRELWHVWMRSERESNKFKQKRSNQITEKRSHYEKK
jgi:hypothetical protein